MGFWWVVTADRDWLGPYTRSRAQDTADRMDVATEVFESSTGNMAEAKQEYRAVHPEFGRKNFSRS